MKKVHILIIGVICVLIFLLKPPNGVNSDSLTFPCSNITGEEEMLFCMALVNDDVSFCNKMNVFEGKSVCSALITMDVSYCRELNNEYCYYELILLTNNITYCDELSDEVQCYWSFVNHLFWRGEFGLIKSEYCELFPEGHADKNDCWAYYYNNASLCGVDETCLTCFEQPLSFCEGVTFESVSDCIRDRALSSRNASICELINNSFMRDDCYMDYSNHVSPNASLCERIINNSIKDMCYLELALRDYTNI